MCPDHLTRSETVKEPFSRSRVITKIGWVAVLLVSISSSGCETYRAEVARVTSPDSTLDGTIVTADGNATVSRVVELYLLQRGGDIKGQRRVFAAQPLSTRLPEVHWVNPSLIEIRVPEAEIFEFQNFWYTPEDEPRKIQIRLVDGTVSNL